MNDADTAKTGMNSSAQVTCPGKGIDLVLTKFVWLSLCLYHQVNLSFSCADD
jgi:hypothetical protein